MNKRKNLIEVRMTKLLLDFRKWWEMSASRNLFDYRRKWVFECNFRMWWGVEALYGVLEEEEYNKGFCGELHLGVEVAFKKIMCNFKIIVMKVWVFAWIGMTFLY